MRFLNTIKMGLESWRRRLIAAVNHGTHLSNNRNSSFFLLPLKKKKNPRLYGEIGRQWTPIHFRSNEKRDDLDATKFDSSFYETTGSSFSHSSSSFPLSFLSTPRWEKMDDARRRATTCRVWEWLGVAALDNLPSILFCRPISYLLSAVRVELKRVSKKWSPILGTSVRTHLKRLKSILQSHPLYSRHPPSPNLLLFLLLTTTLRRFVACDFSLRSTCHQSVSSGTTHKVKFPRCVSFFTLQLN